MRPNVGLEKACKRGAIQGWMRRTVPFAISTHFVIWLFEQFAESSCIRFCSLLILNGHRWQMEVGSKVGVRLTNTGDRRHVRIVLLLVHTVTPIIIYSSRYVFLLVLVVNLDVFVADAIRTV